MPEHDSPLYEMLQEIYQYGIGKGMDAQESLLRLQDGAGRDRSGIPNLRRVADRNEKKFTIPRLELVRDVFVFACFTGLAFSDVASLNKENLVQDNLGDWWIRKGRVKLEHRRKASSISNIPLLPVPLAILEKYKEHPTCIKKGCCLPVMCNQKMNSYLKEIADFCGIKKNLTTHVARHTFGTTVTLANNVPLQDVSVMLGHASTRMTQHYARVMNSSLKEAMNNVKKRLER